MPVRVECVWRAPQKSDANAQRAKEIASGIGGPSLRWHSETGGFIAEFDDHIQSERFILDLWHKGFPELLIGRPEIREVP